MGNGPARFAHTSNVHSRDPQMSSCIPFGSEQGSQSAHVRPAFGSRFGPRSAHVRFGLGREGYAEWSSPLCAYVK